MPTKDRQRQLARAKLERQMARRAAEAKRRRQLLAGVSAGVVVLLLIIGVVFLVAKYGGDDDKATDTAQPGASKCTYTKDNGASGAKVKKTGLPPTSDVPDSGVRTVTMNTSVGVIQFTLDQAAAPCTSNSIAFLIGKKFYDKTACHRLVTTGIFVLQCGDPFGDGTGGPDYRMGVENLPTGEHPPYPAGTVAMAKGQEATSVGSQFFIVYKDTDQLDAAYTVVGKVTKGLNLVTNVAAKGVTPTDPSNPSDGTPKLPVKLTTVTITPNPAG